MYNNSFAFFYCNILKNPLFSNYNWLFYLMAKKLKGDYFYLSANDIISGSVLYYKKGGWSKNVDEALKISRKDIDRYEKIAEDYENKCIIISPSFVELNEDGDISKLRDKIRKNGITFEI